VGGGRPVAAPRRPRRNALPGNTGRASCPAPDRETDMISASLTTAIKRTAGSGSSASTVEPIDGTAEQTIEATVAAASTDAPIAATWPAAQLLAVLPADQDCTVKLNSSTTPTATIALKAGRPLTWSSADGYFARPFPSDVAGSYVSAVAETNLQVDLLK
jgi:hypothetical protein